MARHNGLTSHVPTKAFKAFKFVLLFGAQSQQAAHVAMRPATVTRQWTCVLGANGDHARCFCVALSRRMLIDRAVSLSAARSPYLLRARAVPASAFSALSLAYYGYMVFASVQAYQRDSDAGEPCGADHDNLAAGGSDGRPYDGGSGAVQ